MQVNNSISLAKLYQTNSVAKAESDFKSASANSASEKAEQSTDVSLSLEGKTKAEKEKAIAEKYDVRNMSFKEYHQMADDLFNNGLIDSTTQGWMKVDLSSISEQYGGSPRDNNAKMNFLDRIQGIYSAQQSGANDATSRNGLKGIERELNMLKALDKYA